MSVDLARAMLARFRAESVTFLAAAIAYYAFVSVLPGAMLAVAIASAIGGGALGDATLELTGGFLTPSGEGLVLEAITSSQGRTGASLIGVVLLLWSTLRVFRGLDVAFSRIYGTAAEPSLLDQLRDAGVVLATIVLGIWTMIGLGGVLATTEFPGGGDIVGFALLFAGLVMVFLPLYVVFPDAAVGVAEALPGAVFAAGGWVLLQVGFQLYATSALSTDVYGVIGGAMLLVTWFYLGAIVLLAGAVLNVEWRDRQGQGAPTRRTG